MASNPLLLTRLHTSNHLSPWYALGSRTAALGSTGLAMGQVRSVITKTHTFAAKKKRTKDYSSDSSGTERETDKHTEGRIYRAPSGSGKDYYVYCALTAMFCLRSKLMRPCWCAGKGKKISFGDSSMKNRNDNDGARANFNARHSCSEKKDKSKVRMHLTAYLVPLLTATVCCSGWILGVQV